MAYPVRSLPPNPYPRISLQDAAKKGPAARQKKAAKAAKDAATGGASRPKEPATQRRRDTGGSQPAPSQRKRARKQDVTSHERASDLPQVADSLLAGRGGTHDGAAPSSTLMPGAGVTLGADETSLPGTAAAAETAPNTHLQPDLTVPGVAPELQQQLQPPNELPASAFEVHGPNAPLILQATVEGQALELQVRMNRRPSFYFVSFYSD